MKCQYVPGQGYEVRDCRGRVIARGLTKAQCDALMRMADVSVLSQRLLDTLRS